MSDVNIRTASCLCGSIALTLTGEPMLRLICHCLTCQKASGVVLTTDVVMLDSAVTVNDPQGKIRQFIDRSTASGNTLVRGFCGDCGSNLFVRGGRHPNGAVVTAVGMGLIEGSKEDLRPTMETFLKRRVSWAPTLAGAEHFDAMPVWPGI